METLISFNLNLIVFYLMYLIVFRKSTYFNLNRIYLLAVPFVSYLLTQLSFSFNITSYQVIWPDTFINQIDQMGPTVAVFTPTVPMILLAAYGFVALMHLLGIAIGIRKVFKIRTQAKISDSVYLLNNLENITSFSFFKWVFIEENIDPIEKKIVLEHEFTHVKQWHSADIVFYEIIKALFWLNPFVYLISKELKNVHEYLADREATKNIQDKTSYCELLLSKALPANSLKLTHSFIYINTLKSRIMMITKNNRISLWRYAIIFPVLAGLIYFNSCSKPASTEEHNSNITSPQKAIKQTPLPEHMPEFTGGQEAMIKYLSANINYPDDAKKAKVEGKSVIKFMVDEQGKVNSAKVVISAGKSLDNEAMRSILAMPNWIPAKDKDKNVACEMILPIRFKLD